MTMSEPSMGMAFHLDSLGIAAPASPANWRGAFLSNRLMT